MFYVLGNQVIGDMRILMKNKAAGPMAGSFV